MSDLLKIVLSRVLSEEIRHQEQWKKEDLENGLPETAVKHRDVVIEEIKKFMEENGIDGWQRVC